LTKRKLIGIAGDSCPTGITTRSRRPLLVQRLVRYEPRVELLLPHRVTPLSHFHCSSCSINRRGRSRAVVHTRQFAATVCRECTRPCRTKITTHGCMGARKSTFNERINVWTREHARVNYMIVRCTRAQRSRIVISSRACGYKKKRGRCKISYVLPFLGYEIRGILHILCLVYSRESYSCKRELWRNIRARAGLRVDGGSRRGTSGRFLSLAARRRRRGLNGGVIAMTSNSRRQSPGLK